MCNFSTCVQLFNLCAMSTTEANIPDLWSWEIGDRRELKRWEYRNTAISDQIGIHNVLRLCQLRGSKHTWGALSMAVKSSPRRPQNYFFLLKFVLWVYCHSVWETVVNVIEIDVRFQVQCSAFFIECSIIHISMKFWNRSNLDEVEYLNDMNTLYINTCFTLK